jgi:predicted phage terminase large subunit-like protein
MPDAPVSPPFSFDAAPDLSASALEEILARFLPAGTEAERGRFLLDELRSMEREEEAARCEASLYTYLQTAWPHFDPAPFVGGWHLEAICAHLEAVTRGDIRKLLINIRPRSCKTSAVAIAWPSWVWTLPDVRGRSGATVRFLCGSYGANKAQIDAVTARRLIGGAWYQERWGNRVVIREDRDNQQQYDTVAGGSRVSTGVDESLGRGGDFLLLDDPSKPNQVDSEVQAESVIRGYQEIWSTRANDPKTAGEVMIMQRQGDRDLSGYWLETAGKDVVHLMIPSWYEPERHCTTYVQGHEFWTDPRTEEGESFWPERYGAGARAVDEALGPYAFASQIQQAPEPRGGGIIQRSWWQIWPPPGEEDQWVRPVTLENGEVIGRLRFPRFEYVLVCVDGAYTTKEENDPSGCVVWGVFQDRAKRNRVMLVNAWRDRLEINGLVNRILDTCRTKGREANELIIEGKASGISAAQEVGRRARDGEWTTKVVKAEGDKRARLLRVQGLFSDRMVFAPNRKYASMVIDEMALFPRAPHDDLTDAGAHGLERLRKTGWLQTSVEFERSEAERDVGLVFPGGRSREVGVAEAYGVA